MKNKNKLRWLLVIASILQVLNSGESNSGDTKVKEVAAEVSIDVVNSLAGERITRNATATLANGKIITSLDRDGRDHNDPWKHTAGGTGNNSVTYTNIQAENLATGTYPVLISGSGKSESSGGKSTGKPPPEINWSGSKNYNINSVEIITPLIQEDGVISTPAGTDGRGGNEFAYNAGTVGKLTIVVQIAIALDTEEIRKELAGKISVSIDEIAGSTLIWDSKTSPGIAQYTGGLWEAKAEFTGLPEKNSSFGRKTVTVNVSGDDFSVTKTADCEVFFTHEAKNHAGGELDSPNWYHYWKDHFFPNEKKIISWDANIPYGEANSDSAKIGHRANYNYLEKFDNLNYIKLIKDDFKYYPESLADERSVTGKNRIDLFVRIVRHELQHVQDFKIITQTTVVNRANPGNLKEPTLETMGDFFSMKPIPNCEKPTYKENQSYCSKCYFEHGFRADYTATWEYDARNAEGDDAPAEADWSTGGKQWKR